MLKSLKHIYVATPCTSDWAQMSGDAQKRFCAQCQLNVYDLSAMTSAQAENLIRQNEGNLCIKIYRRADGTIITQDCPVGLKAIRRKVSRVATAAFSLLLSTFTNQVVGWADDGHKFCKHYSSKISRLQSDNQGVVIGGLVSDQANGVISKADVIIFHVESKQTMRAKTDSEGKYRYTGLKAGTYSVTVESGGFATFKKESLKIADNEMLQLNVFLTVGTTGGAAFLPVQPNQPDNKTRYV